MDKFVYATGKNMIHTATTGFFQVEQNLVCRLKKRNMPGYTPILYSPMRYLEGWTASDIPLTRVFRFVVIEYVFLGQLFCLLSVAIRIRGRC